MSPIDCALVMMVRYCCWVARSAVICACRSTYCPVTSTCFVETALDTPSRFTWFTNAENDVCGTCRVTVPLAGTPGEADCVCSAATYPPSADTRVVRDDTAASRWGTVRVIDPVLSIFAPTT